MAKKSPAPYGSVEVIAFDVHGKKKTALVHSRNVEPLVAELGFASAAALFKQNIHLLFLFGERGEVGLEPQETIAPVQRIQEQPLTSEDIERALAILLRAIARATAPQPAMAPPPDDSPEEELVDGLPPMSVSHREGCECPCPDGVNVDFLIEWDAPGPNLDLFSDTLTRGVTENQPGQGEGTVVEIEGVKTVTLNFGNPALGVLNGGDVIVTFTLKPFFGKGFNEEECCITAEGSFVGTARITSFTNRGQQNEKIDRGQVAVNQSISIGECQTDEEQLPCCTAIYRWNFVKRFAVNALGFDVVSSIRGVITVELKVWES